MFAAHGIIKSLVYRVTMEKLIDALYWSSSIKSPTWY